MSENESAPVKSEEIADKKISSLEERQKQAIDIMDRYNNGNEKERREAAGEICMMLEFFIKKMISQNAGTFSNYYDEMMQECFLAVLEHLDRYDPTLSAPTTFFTPIIKHTLSMYTNKMTNRSSPYFSTLANKVKATIKRLEQEDITPTPLAISIESGLDMKKVENAIKVIKGSDECHYESEQDMDSAITAREKSTEQLYMETECEQIWQNALIKLTPREYFMFTSYYGISKKEESYADISKETGTTPRTVSVIIEQARRKLHTDSNICQYYNFDANTGKRHFAHTESKPMEYDWEGYGEFEEEMTPSKHEAARFLSF